MANPRHALAAAGLTILAACVPHFTTYIHLRTSEIEPSACGTSGPPVIARYVREDTRFEVALEPGLLPGAPTGFMRMAPPPDSTVILEDHTGYVSLDDGGPPIRFQLQLAPAPPGGMTEPRFDFRGLPSKIEFDGTLHLPDVIVNGKTVVAPVFEFHRQRYAGPAPKGCS